MSLSSKRKRKMAINVSETKKLQDIVDNLSDLSDIDTDSEDEVCSNSSSYLKEFTNNSGTHNEIESRLEQLFGIPHVEDEASELNEQISTNSLRNILEENRISASHPKTPESLIPSTPASLVQIEQAFTSPQTGLPSTELSTAPISSEVTAVPEAQISTPTSVPVQSKASTVKILSCISLPYRNTAHQSGSQSSVRTAPTNSKVISVSSILPLPKCAKLSSSTSTTSTAIDQTQVDSFPHEGGLPSSHPKSSAIPSTPTGSNLSWSQSPVYPSTSYNQSTISTNCTLRTGPLISSNRSRNPPPREWKIVQEHHAVPDFDKKIVPQSTYTHKTQPITIFYNFFPESVIESIVVETNRYASQKKSKNWEDVTLQEMKAYFGVLIMMGLNPLPDMELYWSSDRFYNNPEISTVFPITRYKKITENLHLRNNAEEPPRTSPNYDKLYKLRTLIDTLNDVFQKQTSNSSRQSIDECMVKFKGRSCLKQYMPKKPVKRGFKIWARCDAVTGYLYQFEVYAGKGDSTENEGLGYNVVWRLCQNVPPNTLVAFDNFFTGCNLMDDLFGNDIYAVGTVRLNRIDLPDAITKNDRAHKLNKNEFAALTAGPLSAIKWADSRLVTVLTTAHDPRDTMIVKRTQKDGTKRDTLIPTAIASYTLNMGGVDHFDHFRSSYPINRKSRKFWMRLFLFMLDASVINAYITYTTIHPTTVHLHRDFRLRLARGLIDGYTSKTRKTVQFKNKKGGNFGVPDEIRLRNVGEHLPTKDESYKRCRFCSTKAKEKRTNIKCCKCDVSLCAQECFKNFHTIEFRHM